jgi:hypothetical protein
MWSGCLPSWLRGLESLPGLIGQASHKVKSESPAPSAAWVSVSGVVASYTAEPNFDPGGRFGHSWAC